MSSRYLVVDNALGTYPVVASETDEIEIAIKKFKEIAKKTLESSIILYDSKDDSIRRVFMQSEPILLVKAIEYARLRTHHSIFRDTTIKNDPCKTSPPVETKLIKSIVDKLAKRSTCGGIEHEDMEHMIAPVMTLDRTGAGTAGAAVGFYGALSGSAMGFFAGGPTGAVVGGIIGGLGLGSGTKSLIETAISPNQCPYCNGSGLEGNNYRCTKCDGYGYTKEDI